MLSAAMTMSFPFYTATTIDMFISKATEDFPWTDHHGREGIVLSLNGQPGSKQDSAFLEFKEVPRVDAILLHAAERLVELDRAGSVLQGPGDQLPGHEHFGGDLVLAGEAEQDVAHHDPVELGDQMNTRKAIKMLDFSEITQPTTAQ